MHALALGGAAAFMILLGLFSSESIGLPIAISAFITGVVCTSRLIVSDHHPFEIYTGLIVGAACQMIAGFFIM